MRFGVDGKEVVVVGEDLRGNFGGGVRERVEKVMESGLRGLVEG